MYVYILYMYVHRNRTNAAEYRGTVDKGLMFEILKADGGMKGLTHMRKKKVPFVLQTHTRHRCVSRFRNKK